MDNNDDTKTYYKTYKYSFSFAFKQQLLKAWQPKPTLKCAIIIYLILGIIFIAIGLIIVSKSNSIIEINTEEYNIACKNDTNCTIYFNVTEEMEQPIYLYYKIDGFYQNHRRYVKSVSNKQLRGENLGINDLSDCTPAITNRDMGKNYSLDNTTLDQDAAAFPCGLVARSYFNDTFLIYYLSNTTTNANISTTIKGIS